MLDLNISQIRQTLVFDEAVARIKEAYIKTSQGEVQTGDVVHLAFPGHNGDCHVKCGHINGADNYVIKIATGFYDNPLVGLPSSNGMMLAFSANTGAPVAILRDEGWLTDLRTGIGGAIVTQLISPDDAREVLIVGTGIQAEMQAKCLAKMGNHHTYSFSFWGRDRSKTKGIVSRLCDEGISATETVVLEAAVKMARVIITTTPSASPLIESDWVQPGTHITAIGADSPGKQELSVELVQRADLLICDMARQSLAHGEFQHAAAADPTLKVVELGDVLSDAHPGRADKSDSITIADLTGIAAQDIAIAQAVIAAANG